jgi:inhibitor of the pro-sigma K processing machinery
VSIIPSSVFFLILVHIVLVEDKYPWGGVIHLEPIFVISILGGLIVLLLIMGAPMRSARALGQAAIKLLVGALFLFFLNTLGNQYGIHVPINFFTTAVSGFLGVPGIAALVAVNILVIG